MKKIQAILIAIIMIATILPIVPNVKADGSTLILRPNAEGSLQQYYVQNSSTHWEAVDEVIPETAFDSPMVYTNGGNIPGADKEYFNIQDHTTETGTIDNVTVYACIAGQTGAYVDGFTLAINDTTNQQESTAFPFSMTWVNYSYTFTTNPAGGSWTWSNIDNLQTGVLFYDYTDDPYFYVTQIYAVVNYAPAGPEPPAGGPTDTINITLHPGGTIDIICNQSTWAPSASIGGNASTPTTWGSVLNNGTVQVDVTVEATNTTAWVLGTSPGNNQFQLQYGTGTGGGGSPENLILRPNGPPIGHTNNWQCVGDTPSWACLDDVICDNDTTTVHNYNGWPGSGRTEDWVSVTDHSTEIGTISKVQVTYFVGWIDAGDCYARFAIYDQNTLDEVQSPEFALPGEWDYIPYSYNFTTAPDGGSWSWDAIDDLEIGINQTNGNWDDGGSVWISQAFITVYYTTGGGGGATWTNITTSPASFVNDLSYDASQDFGLQIFMPTSSSTNANQTTTITFKATAN